MEGRESRRLIARYLALGVLSPLVGLAVVYATGLTGLFVPYGGLSVASFLVAWSLWAVHPRWALVGRVILAVCLVAAIAVLIPLFLDPGLYMDVQAKARLAADQGTLDAMQAAVAAHYARYGRFPEHPGHYVVPTPPVFQCAGLTYTYSPATGELRMTSANPLKDCR